MFTSGVTLNFSVHNPRASSTVSATIEASEHYEITIDKLYINESRSRVEETDMHTG
jgi:hypothetical protein